MAEVWLAGETHGIRSVCVFNPGKSPVNRSPGGGALWFLTHFQMAACSRVHSSL